MDWFSGGYVTVGFIDRIFQDIWVSYVMHGFHYLHVWARLLCHMGGHLFGDKP